MICIHEHHEKEPACADGMCPLCLAEDCKRLREWLRYIQFNEAGGPAADDARQALNGDRLAKDIREDLELLK